MPAVQVRNMITLLVKNRQIVGEHADAWLAAMKQAETDRSKVPTLKQMTIEIVVPPYHKEGAKLMCRTSDGVAHTVAVPAGATPGTRLRFKVKRPQGSAPPAGRPAAPKPS